MGKDCRSPIGHIFETTLQSPVGVTNDHSGTGRVSLATPVLSAGTALMRPLPVIKGIPRQPSSLYCGQMAKAQQLGFRLKELTF